MSIAIAGRGKGGGNNRLTRQFLSIRQGKIPSCDIRLP
jgi:hypothetical protein